MNVLDLNEPSRFQDTNGKVSLTVKICTYFYFMTTDLCVLVTYVHM